MVPGGNVNKRQVLKDVMFPDGNIVVPGGNDERSTVWQQVKLTLKTVSNSE